MVLTQDQFQTVKSDFPGRELIWKEMLTVRHLVTDIGNQ